MNRLERPQNFPAKAQKLSNATTSLYRWRLWGRIILTVNTCPVPDRRPAQGHSKPVTDPELNAIPIFSTVYLFWLLVNLKMKPSVIRSSSSRSRMFRRGAETKATAGQEQPHPLLLSPSTKGTSQWLSGKESACNSGDPGGLGSIPGSGRFPGERNDNPLQYSCLENPMDRGTWPAIVCEVAQSQAQLKQLSTHACNLWFG